MRYWVKYMALSSLLLTVWAGENLWAAQDLDLTGGTQFAYDTNITYAERDEIADFANISKVGFGWSSEHHTSYAELEGTATQQTFLSKSEFNNLSTDLFGFYRQEFSKYSAFNVSDNLINGEEPRTFEDQFGRTLGRFNYVRNRLNMEWEQELSRQTDGRVKYFNEYYNPSDAATSNSMLNLVGGEFEHHFSSAISVLGIYEFSYRSFELRGTHSTENHFGTGGRKYFSPQLYLEGRGGISFIQDFAGQTSTKPRYQVSLINEIDRRTRRGIVYERHFKTTSTRADIFDSWRLSFEYGKQFFSRLRGDFSGFVGEGEFVNSAVKDKLYGVSSSFTYELSKHWQSNVSYVYSQTNSTEATREYVKNFISMGFQFNF